ncbi:hypothetical protein BJ508DRAFT_170665 [Ascobolus immersus RN42]|uniref:Uncharacterized protein n=1 Tax=Ascobolus immersus RN42 TaxID=1160509 RepID=A0A3N4HUC2_ASCIM|nr:hypothetical protein BJ508DRAFT_170665 [Ascobolus immersus RN42]
MTTFYDLPFELRIAIFEQIETSEAAFAFRLIDHDTYLLITPTLYRKHGFLTPKELMLLDCLQKKPVLRMLTCGLFFRIICSGQLKPYVPQKRQAVSPILFQDNKSESGKRETMQLLKYATQLVIKHEGPLPRETDHNIDMAQRHMYAHLLSAPNEGTASVVFNFDDRTNMRNYKRLKRFFNVFYFYSETDEAYRSSSVYKFARSFLRANFDYNFGPLRYGPNGQPRQRTEVDPVTGRRRSPPCMKIEKGLLVEAKDCKGVFKAMRWNVEFMKEVKRVYEVSALSEGAVLRTPDVLVQFEKPGFVCKDHPVD